MSKRLRSILIIAAALVAVIFLGIQGFIRYTKSHSPLDNPVYEQGNCKIEVVYCQPSKKGRDIFGGIVPYGVVWRTGANEATIFETNQDIRWEERY